MCKNSIFSASMAWKNPSHTFQYKWHDVSGSKAIVFSCIPCFTGKYANTYDLFKNCCVYFHIYKTHPSHSYMKPFTLNGVKDWVFPYDYTKTRLGSLNSHSWGAFKRIFHNMCFSTHMGYKRVFLQILPTLFWLNTFLILRNKRWHTFMAMGVFSLKLSVFLLTFSISDLDCGCHCRLCNLRLSHKRQLPCRRELSGHHWEVFYWQCAGAIVGRFFGSVAALSLTTKTQLLCLLFYRKQYALQVFDSMYLKFALMLLCHT